MSDHSEAPSPDTEARKPLVRAGTRSECAACTAIFGSVTAFDAHRTGPHDFEYQPGRFKPSPGRRCLGDLAATFTRDSRSYWVLP